MVIAFVLFAWLVLLTTCDGFVITGRVRSKRNLQAGLEPLPPPGPPPKCLLVAPGTTLTESNLDTLDDILATMIGGEGVDSTPVVILSSEHIKHTLRTCLFGSTCRDTTVSIPPLYQSHDHLLPSNSDRAVLGIPEVPVIFFSGVHPQAVRGIISAVRSTDSFPPSAFAITVRTLHSLHSLTPLTHSLQSIN